MGSRRTVPQLLAALLGAGFCLAGCLESDALFSYQSTGVGSGGGNLGGDSGTGAQGGAGMGTGGDPSENDWDDCTPYQEGLALEVCSSGYQGGAGDDQIVAASALSSSWLVAVLVSEADSWGDLPTLRGANGPALLATFDRTGRTRQFAVRVGERIGEISVDDERVQVLALIDDSLVALSLDLSKILWEQSLGSPGIRLDLSPSGESAVLTEDGRVRSFSPEGEPGETFDIQEGEASDLALSIDATRVFVVGEKADPSALCQGQVPFLRAYSRSGDVVARAYDFDTVSPECASSRGLRVSLGADGKLYYAGSNHGGNTVHRKDPADLANPAPLIATDLYNQGYGTAIQRYGFVARFTPETLGMEIGSLILPRDDMDVGGEYLIDALEADADGHVYVGARATCCISERDARTVAGTSLGPYAEPEATLLILSANFRDRFIWTSFTETAQAATGSSVLALGSDGIVFAQTTEAPTQLITEAAENDEVLGERDGFLSVIRTR